MMVHLSSHLGRPVMSKILVALLLASIAGTARSLGAQSNLSAQGLGYPTGQLSARAEGAGGAIAEIDPMSLVNPAALGFIGTTTLFFQIEPEYRRVTNGSAVDKTTTARYPLFAAVIPVGSNWAVAVSSATLLDRTWTTTVDSNVVFGTDTVPSTFLYGSSGSINDLRLALAWSPRSYVRFGLGGHLISGSDRVFVGRTFTNNSAFGNFADSTTLGFDGGAVSAGVQLIAPKLAVASASFRKGGNINASRNDTTLASARIPDRLGFSLAYIGAAGTEIAARTSLDKWSSLNGLSRGTSQAVDAWDTSIGADVAGPRLGSQPLMLRVGGRWRTLPYTLGPTNDKVKEQSFSAGFGTTFGGGRVITDVTVIHARRDAGIEVNERAWTLSIGLGIRP
jgi:hypothetical protein